MATYKGIRGSKVQSLASDPTASESVGRVWYNTTSNVLKYTAVHIQFDVFLLDQYTIITITSNLHTLTMVNQ